MRANHGSFCTVGGKLLFRVLEELKAMLSSKRMKSVILNKSSRLKTAHTPFCKHPYKPETLESSWL